MYRMVLLHATLLSRDLYKRVLDYKKNQGRLFANTAFCFTAAAGLSFSTWAVSRFFHKLQSDNTRILKMLQSDDTRILNMIAEKLLLRVNHLEDRLQDLKLAYSVQVVMAVAGLSAYMYRRLRDIDGDIDGDVEGDIDGDSDGDVDGGDGANAAPAG